MKIALLDCSNKEYSEIRRLSSPSKIKYCELHGYKAIFDTETTSDRFPTWNKILSLRKHLYQYDYICFLDTDIFVMNIDTKIEDQIEDQIEDKNIYISTMPDFNNGKETHLSTSAFIIKNSPWSKDFLDHLWNTTDFLNTYYPPDKVETLSTRGFGGIYHEQSAFSYLYDISSEVRKNVKIMPFCWFNHREVNYSQGDFLIHFARQKDKLKRMKNFYGNNLIKFL